MFSRKGKSIIATLCILAGIMHFIIGPDYHGPYRLFFSGYFMDILLPLSLFLLFQIPLRTCFSIPKSRLLSGSVVLLIGFGTETMQYYQIPIFGNTFDPLDYVMFVLGVFSGLMVDIFVLNKHITSNP